MKNSIDFKDIWQEMLDFLKQDPEIGPVKVNIWLAQVKPLSLVGDTYTLEVPNTMFRQAIQSKYEKKISDFLKNILCLNSELHASYIIAAEPPGPLPILNSGTSSAQAGNAAGTAETNKESMAHAAAEIRAEAKQDAAAVSDRQEDIAAESEYDRNLRNAEWQPSMLRGDAAEAKPADPKALHPEFNPDYTFETFIVGGSSNRFAFAAAKALVNNHQSPLFIYSQPGLGKTHLLHAIAHGLYRLNPKIKVLLSATETFVNEFIRDVVKFGGDRADAFRSKYRNLDCLLLDDVQFLLDKEKSVEEFFYTFNALFESKKRIVITSDRQPKELALGERLISRFMSGTVADIRLPDFETRVAILRQKSDQWKYDIPLDIINFIAQKVRKGGRELEGCIITVNNFCRNTGARATIDVVQDLLKDHFWSPSDNQVISIETIKKVVAERYNVEVKDLSGQRRDDAIVRPRMTAIYLATVMTDMTLESIGNAFKRNHASIIHSRDKMKEKVMDPFENEEINKLIKKIKDVNSSEELC